MIIVRMNTKSLIPGDKLYLESTYLILHSLLTWPPTRDGTGRPWITETFVTYGYLFDQRFDFGNYGGITGGFRTDYSSAFGAGSKPFTFPSF